MKNLIILSALLFTANAHGQTLGDWMQGGTELWGEYRACIAKGGGAQCAADIKNKFKLLNEFKQKQAQEMNAFLQDRRVKEAALIQKIRQGQAGWQDLHLFRQETLNLYMQLQARQQKQLACFITAWRTDQQKDSCSEVLGLEDAPQDTQQPQPIARPVEPVTKKLTLLTGWHGLRR